MPHGAIPFPFGDCQVCSDAATGVHYGVATCEGCKGFFKRSLQKADKYHCFNDGQCSLRRADRTRCKACRFRRCLVVGMSLQGVKMGRIPKVEKERALQQQQAASSSSSSSSSSCQPADADSPSLSALPPADISSACLTCHRADVDVDVDRPSLSAVSDVTLNGCRPMAETTTTMTSADLNVTSAVNGRCQAQTMTNGCTTLHHGDDDAQHTRSSNRHQGLTPYGPTVIKELLNEAIETGRGQEVRHNIARHFFSFSLNRLTTATAVDSNPAVTQTAEDGHLRHSCSAVEAAVSVESTSRDSAVCIHPLAVQTCQVIDTDQWTTPCGLWKSSEMVEANASHPCGTPTLPAAGADVGMVTGLESRLEETGAEALSLPDVFFNYSDLEALKNWLPRLHVWYDDKVSAAAAASGVDSGSQLTLRADEMEAVLNRFKLVADVITKRIQMSEELYNQERRGHRPVHSLNAVQRKVSADDVHIIWNELMASVPMNNACILGLCEVVPGFGDLDSKDKATLMEASYFDLWLIVWSPLMHHEDCFLRLPCGGRYSKWWMQVFLPESLVKAMFHFSDELNACQLTPVESIILCAIQLTSPTGRSLVDAMRVQQLHDYYLDLLAYEIERSHVSTHSRILIKIFQLLPLLVPINAEQAVAIMNLRVDAPPESTVAAVTNNSVAMDTDDDDVEM